jgi:Fe-S-cluster containining protein
MMSTKAQQQRTDKLLATRRRRLALLARQRPSADAQVDEHLIFHQAGATLEILAEGCTAAKAVEVGANVSTYLDRLLAALGQRHEARVACRAGCWWCCTLPGAIAPPEALALAAWLREHLSAADLAALTAAIQAQAAEVAPLTVDAHANARIPCALLRDGQCTAYAARPLACRGWASMDAAACEAGYWQPWEAAVPVWSEARAFRGDLAFGLFHGSLLAQVDANTYELHSALARALTSPDAAARWARGEAVFAGCKPGPQPPPELVPQMSVTSGGGTEKEQ